jgi:hypothetical protein
MTLYHISQATVTNKTTRQKIFGGPKSSHLNDKQKREIMANARRLRTEAANNKAPTPLTRTAIDILAALVWRFHNRTTGHCFPSYEAIAKAAGCSVRAVSEAIQALEAHNIITWSNRIIRRIKTTFNELLGENVRSKVVERTSNTYTFTAPQSEDRAPKGKTCLGTQPLFEEKKKAATCLEPNSSLFDALGRFKEVFDKAHWRK